MIVWLFTLLALQAPAQAPATGLIAGQVVDADTGRPVPGAIVRLGPPLRLMDASGPGDYRLNATTFGMRWIEADGQGRFVIRSVPNGEYLIALDTPGYLLSGYDQQRPNGPLRPIVLSGAGAVRTGVQLKAWKLAAIEGTIRDEAGEPAVGIEVRALRLEFRGGHQTHVSAGTAETDDRGRYRLAELEPGQYLVVVPAITVTLPGRAVAEYHAEVAAGRRPPRSRGLGSPILPGPGDLVVASQPRRLVPPSGTYPTTFHRAAASPQDAARITLAPGDERLDVDVALRVLRTFTISGMIDGLAQVPGPLTVTLLPPFATAPGAPFALETASTIATADGSFTFLGVPEGQYEINILRVPPPVEAMTPTTFQRGGETTTIFSVSPGERRASADPTVWARVPVAVTDEDLTGIRVPLREGARVSGRIEFRGSAPPPTPAPNRPFYDVELVGVEGRLLPAFTAARADEAMRFTTMQHPPGRYVVSVNLAPPPWKLRSVTINGRDALTTPFELGDRDIADVVVTFVDRETALEGTVRSGGGMAPVDGAMVVLFPTDVRAWISTGMSRRVFRTAVADDGGAFTMGDLLPGEYLIAAVAGDALVDLQDPGAILQLARAATGVTVGEGERASVSLTLAAVR